MLLPRLRALGQWIESVFSDEENPEEPQYDPVHIIGVIVVSLFALSGVFWVLWSLLVFGGGIQAKVMPLLRVVFTQKTVADFGYLGYPYEMGVFEGWPTNCIAAIIGCGLCVGIWYLFKSTEK